MKIRINHNLQCEVDQKKDDCKREPAHCHITKGSSGRVAQVWLNPVILESGHGLDRSEVDEVLSVVQANRYELEHAYRYNAEHGAD